MASKKIVKKSAAVKSAKVATKTQVAKSEKDPFVGQYQIMRGHTTGVFFGKLVSRKHIGDGKQEVTFSEGRRIWRWFGPNTLEGVASVGVDISRSKVESAPDGKIALVGDVTQLILCSDAAIKSIKAATFVR